MDARPRVLILGATGRTGGRVLAQLTAREVPVRAIVRSPDRLPAEAAVSPLLDVVEAELLTLSPTTLAGYLVGCDTVISCLGHTISVRGILGPPHDLVARAVRLVRAAVETMQPAVPIHLILMSSVSVHRRERVDARRGGVERAYLWGMRAVVPPARDNQRAADLLAREVGDDDPHLQWVVVRPDTLTDGDVAEYRVHDGLVASLFRPDSTRMAEAAHFMCELATDDEMWRRWRGRMPVIVDLEPRRS